MGTSDPLSALVMLIRCSTAGDSLLVRCFTAASSLVDLFEEISIEDPFASLRLLQVCGVNRFGHIISAVPPPLVDQFATARDEAVASIFAVIQQAHPPETSTHSLPVGAGGASITSLAKHA